jgi:hypothetical protein
VKKTLIGVLVAAATTIGTAAFAQPPQAAGPDPTWTPPSAPTPPPPPQAQPAPVYTYAAPAPAAPAAGGQWVYTTQYGWIWTPYDASYTYVSDANVAYTFAYYPRFGWRWVSSPWVLGVGPSPFWGRLGRTHFAWYGHPVNRGHWVGRGGWYARPAAPAPRVVVYGRGGHGGHHR